MLSDIMLFAGSILVLFWGIAHIVKTGEVVSGFALKSLDDRRVLTMEWIAEGLTLCFLGLLVIAVTLIGGAGNAVAVVVYRISAIMLVAMAVLSLFTGARVGFVAYKLCPVIFLSAAVLFFLGSVL
jgi:hypothetical protein